MKRSGIWAAGVVLVLLVVGAGVLAGGAGYAEDNGDNGDENAVAKCSKATLDGTYLFAHDGVDISGTDQAPFAIAGMEKYDGKGKVKGVATANLNGDVHHEHFDATYTVKANCTGTVTSGPTQQDVFIAPDGSMFTFVQTKPPEKNVTSGLELQGTAKRVGD
jgi:hypothetical protein